MSLADRMTGGIHTITVTCKSCGKQYRQEQEDQVPGFRMRDYDVCPYCKAENGSSMSVEFNNSKMEG